LEINDYLTHWDKALHGGLYPTDYEQYLTLNRFRFDRIYKTFSTSLEFNQLLDKIHQKSTWIIVTEPWCGDAAQNVPVLLRIIEQLPGASYSLELRDQGSLIDRYLTHGKRSIPKVIVRDENHEDIFTWGPRPKTLQKRVDQLSITAMEKKELHSHIHSFYAKNKGQEVMEEITELVRQRMVKS